jgi:hypothetical protein
MLLAETGVARGLPADGELIKFSSSSAISVE